MEMKDSIDFGAVSQIIDSNSIGNGFLRYICNNGRYIRR